MVKPKIDGHWYYFKEKSGIMATGWSKHNNHTYYYQLNGWMTYGERKLTANGITSMNVPVLWQQVGPNTMAIHIIINLMVR